VRLTLVDNLLYERSFAIRRADLQPHLGLMSLAAAARRDGHEPSIYDPKWEVYSGRLALDSSLYDRMARALLDTAPDVVGFTALGCNFHCVVQVATRVRQLAPRVPILLGGPHATILHTPILERFPAFDVVARHEAETTIGAILSRLPSREFADVAGITYRDHAGAVTATPNGALIDDLDTLPRPEYELYPLSAIGLTGIRVEAGRGCPFSCTFCSTASFFGRLFRLKSAPRLVGEMDDLRTRYGFTAFHLNHDLFTVNRRKVEEFCDAVKDRGYSWRCSARADCVDEALLTSMAEAGCTHIYFGVETASRRMQELSRKRLDVGLVEPIVGAAERLGIATTTSFIVGYPDESREDLDETLDFAGRLHCRTPGTNVSQIHLLTPEPGTDLMARHQDRMRLDGHVSEFNFPMLHDGDRALIAEHAKVFSNHHYYPSAVSRERLIFVSSAWTVLWVLGPSVARYLLTPFDGRLSRFLDEAFAWYEAGSPDRWNADARDLTAFLAGRFGARHHLVSLFRYAQAMDRISRVLKAPRRPDAARDDYGPDVPLTLPDTVGLLPAAHDCAELVEKLRTYTGDRMLPEIAAGPCQNLLLVGVPPEDSCSPGTVATYVVDEPTAALLARFERPTTYWECCDGILDGDEGSPLPDWAELTSLCRMGVLDAAS